MKFRRVNFFGGPCTGKSTHGGGVFSALKKAGIEAYWVQESIKSWTFIGRSPDQYSDQLEIFTNQVIAESQALRKCDAVVCDAPLFLNCYYGMKFNRKFYRQCEQMALEFEEDYPSVNIYLNRRDLVYSEVGRYQTKDEAVSMDLEVHSYILSLCTQAKRTMYEFDSKEESKILDFVLRTLKSDGV